MLKQSDDPLPEGILSLYAWSMFTFSILWYFIISPIQECSLIVYSCKETANVPAHFTENLSAVPCLLEFSSIEINQSIINQLTRIFSLRSETALNCSLTFNSHLKMLIQVFRTLQNLRCVMSTTKKAAHPSCGICSSIFWIVAELW